MMYLALRAKFRQNAVARKALLATEGLTLVHILPRDSSAFPGVVFARMLTEIRDEYLARGDSAERVSEEACACCGVVCQHKGEAGFCPVCREDIEAGCLGCRQVCPLAAIVASYLYYDGAWMLLPDTPQTVRLEITEEMILNMRPTWTVRDARTFLQVYRKNILQAAKAAAWGVIEDNLPAVEVRPEQCLGCTDGPANNYDPQKCLLATADRDGHCVHYV